MKSTELFSVEGYGVVVTGGASGLGLAFAEALAENGAAVTILDVDGTAIEAEVPASPARATTFAARSST